MKSLLLALTLFSLPSYASLNELNNLKTPFSLAPLPYSFNSLNQAIDQETMKIHHGKHHQAYVDKANEAYGKEGTTLLSLLKNASKQDLKVRNNTGGHWNHSFFWSILSGKTEDQEIPESLEAEIEKTFGSWEKFQEAFEKAGADQFGSGWVWLIVNGQGRLEITSTPNQDNPLMDVAKVRGWPILGADVWEHAYYLKYKNERPEYLKSLWSVINWRKVQELRGEAKTLPPLK
jgi:superoxide dismutase, Fe-Mn family